MSRRPLTLHVSALSNAEFTAYTKSFTELTTPPSDADWDKLVFSVREVRGWLRGRYSAQIDGATIDEILKNFSPDLRPQDVLTGGQFFAVLRLVSHIQAGSQLDESLVFMQPALSSALSATQSQSHRPKGASWDVSSSSESSKPFVPPPPPRPSLEDRLAPCLSNTISPASPAPSTRTPASQVSASGLNPFTCSPTLSSYPPKSSESSTNPFRPPLGKPMLRGSLSSPTSSTASSSPPKSTMPPLPPRKPALLPPPRHASLTKGPPAPPPSSKASVYSNPSLPQPGPPPKPPKVKSPLIKQSLQAARGAQTAKETLDSLSKERRLEVIKKSGDGSSHDRLSSSSSATARSLSPPRSLYDVAAARVGSEAGQSSPAGRSPSPHSSSPSDDEDITTHHTDQRQSPTPGLNVVPATPSTNHPPRGSQPFAMSVSGFTSSQSATEPFATLHNPRRTKSLHHPSPSTSASTNGHLLTKAGYQTPPVPPPRRRRPESLQVTHSPFADGGDDDMSPKPSRQPWRPSSAPRRASFSPHGSAPGSAPLSSSMSGSGSQVIDALQRTFATLKPGSGFESARVRAEGRVLPSGYAKVGRESERLVDEDGEEDDPGYVVREEDEDSVLRSTSTRWASNDTARGATGGLVGHEEERDAFKVPVRPEEGWVAL